MLLSFTISRQKSSHAGESKELMALKEVKAMSVRDSRMKSDRGVRTDSHGEIYRRGAVECLGSVKLRSPQG